MSSTYVHYHEPSSLPTDYALASHFPHSADERSTNNDTFTDSENENESDLDTRRPAEGPATRFRRLTGTSERPLSPLLERDTSYAGTTNPAIPDEHTPLLVQVPRIEEHDEREQPTLWNECKILIRYTLPVLGSHLLEYTLVVTSVVSIGHISTTALAASTLGSMTASVTGFSIIQGFTSALDTLLPSAWTSSHPELVGLWSQRMAVVMAATLVPIFAIWFNSESILLFLKQDPEVAHLASLYLRYLSIGLPAYTFNATSRRYFQSQGLFTVPTRIIIIVSPLNVALNYLLVWGPKSIALGFIGAPIATAISMNLISLASMAIGIRKYRQAKCNNDKIAWHPFSLRIFTNLGILVQLGLAGVGQTASEWWSWELVGLAASMLGPISLASQSVLLVSASTAYQAPFATSVAAAVRIGNLLGEGDARRAKQASEASLLIVLLFAGITSTLFLSLRNRWAYIFNDDPEVVNLVASILPLVALFQVFDGLGGGTAGILRARGKQFLGAMLNLSAYYVIGIPFGIWLAFSKQMGLTGLWIGLTISLVYVSTVGVIVCIRTDWQREVKKVEARLREGQKGRDQAEVSEA